MKLVLLLTLSLAANAKNLNWSQLYEDTSYRLTLPLNFELKQDNFRVEKGAVIKLKKLVDLPMINVKHFQFALKDCPSTTLENNLDLLEVNQPNGSVVDIGYNLAVNCTLEVFIEQKDRLSQSILENLN